MYFYRCFIGLQLLISHLIRIVERSLADGVAGEIEQHLRQAFKRKELIDVPVAEESLQTSPVLHWVGDIRWK